MTTDEIKAIQKDPSTTMIEHLIISILGKAAKDGDQKRMNMILDRVIGPVIRPVPVFLPPDNPTEPQAPEGVTIDVTKISDTALKELMYAGTTAVNK